MPSRIVRLIGPALIAGSILLSFGAQGQRLDTTRVARAIAPGVGAVGDSRATGKKGPIFVFEEYHNSRVGQLQIAVMLLRLHDQHGVREFGVEGAIQGTPDLSATWYHQAGGADAQGLRDAVAVRMLAEGEVGAGEFLALVRPTARVFGLELRSEYDVALESEGSAQVFYLMKIAEKHLSQADIRSVNRLIEQKKLEEAIEHILMSDPWVRTKYEVLKAGSITSIDGMAQLARDIRDRAREQDVEIDAENKANMDKTIAFFEAATQRSSTMTSYILNQASVKSGAAAAMQIGAGHTSQILGILKTADASYAQIAPKALNPDFAILSNEQFARKNVLEWTRTTEGTLGRLLNAKRKPPPIIGTATAHSYASLNLAVLIVAKAARLGKRVPDDIWGEISGLPELSVDRDSFFQDGYDIVFRAWPIDTAGRKREVWIRAGTSDTKRGADSLEARLVRAIADLDDSDGIPPQKPPSNSTATKDEGPSDGKRAEVVVSRIDAEVVAVFAASRDKAAEIGRLSS
jgi:hypothetical protein